MRGIRLLYLAPLVMTIVLVGVPASAGTGGGWTITDLGVGPDSGASAVNDRGVVVGTSESRGGFIWKNGSVTYLGPGTAANDINDRGDVVGERDTIDGLRHAVLWHDGVETDLGALQPGGWSVATAINKFGVVVGFGSFGPRYQAFRWQNGVMTNLALGPAWSTAESINDRGDVVGISASSPGMPRAFLLRDGTMALLGVLVNEPGADQTGAAAINNHGDVVGWAKAEVGPNDHAVRWIDQTIEDLGTFGGLSADASAVNDHGVVVGNSVPINAVWDHSGFVWKDGAGQLIAPDDHTWAADVNDHGQVVGSTYSGHDGHAAHAALFVQK